MSNRDNAKRRKGKQTKSAGQDRGRTSPKQTGKRAARDEELDEIIASVDVLELVERDTGETGHRSGKYVYFAGRCPICGHNDCFRIYPQTNSWACFGGSSEKSAGRQAAGGNSLDYLERRNGGDKSAAVDELRELAGKPRERRRKPERTKSKAAPTAKQRDSRENGTGDGFPPITHSAPDNPPKRSPVLIDGVLRRGHKLLVTAASKAGKTWLMLELAVAVATGGTWLKWECAKGRVLYVNFEVDAPSQENRLRAVAQAVRADISAVKTGVDFWHLRGHAQGMDAFTAALLARVRRGDYSLVILDPLYKVLDGDENSAGDVREFWNKVDEICTSLGCAVAATHHHSKGGKGDVAAIDRGSGSGVFGRDPDAPIDMVRLFPPTPDDSPLAPGASAYRVSDSGLREFPSMEPFNVIFEYPRHRVDEEGVTDGWKARTSQQRGGNSTSKVNKANAEVAAMEIVARLYQHFAHEHIGREGVPLADAAEVCGCDGRKVKAAIDERTGGRWFMTYHPSANRCRVVLAHPPARLPEQPKLE